jgi:hypothetical protein
MKCTFTSEWDDGSIVTTPCEYDPETGEVNPEVSKGPAPEGSLEREYITLPDGDERKVCSRCHTFVIKIAVGDLADLSYGEYEECMNPDCESKLIE